MYHENAKTDEQVVPHLGSQQFLFTDQEQNKSAHKNSQALVSNG